MVRLFLLKLQLHDLEVVKVQRSTANVLMKVWMRTHIVLIKVKGIELKHQKRITTLRQIKL